MSEETICHSRRETAFSPESTVGSSDAHAVGFLSAFLVGRGADRRWCSGASEVEGRRLGVDGQAFPITERHRVQIKFNGD